MVEAVAPGRTAPWVGRLVTPSGRVNRRSYALVGLGSGAAVVAVGVAVFEAMGWQVTGWSLAAGVVGIAAAWVWVATSIKRLHDIGLSGLVMLFVLTPLAGPVFILLVCLLAPGEGAANRYGPVPPARLEV